MTGHTIDTISDANFPDEDGQVQDEVFTTREVKNIAWCLTFVLFDEIIKDSPTQSRRGVFDPNKIKEDLELLNSINANRIITPIVVRNIGKTKQGDREYALVAGHRRVASGKAAGLNGTNGYVTKPDEDHGLLTFVENTGRRELSTFEKRLSLQSLQEQRIYSVKKVAEVTGISKSYVNELIQALQAPVLLISIWEEGALSPKAIVLLKEHWGLLEKEEATPLLKHIRGLSQQQASGLNNLLSAGTPLKKPLSVIMSTSNNKTAPGKTISKASSSGQDIADTSKDALLTAMGEVFPQINEKKARVLYGFTVVNGIQDLEILWAASLYVERGGSINEAVALTSIVMQRRSRKIILAQEVKLMKKVACAINTLKKEDNIIIAFMNIVFSSRR